MIKEILDLAWSYINYKTRKAYFWFNDTFGAEHECRFRQGDVVASIGTNMEPLCLGCGKTLSETED